MTVVGYAVRKAGLIGPDNEVRLMEAEVTVKIGQVAVVVVDEQSLPDGFFMAPDFVLLLLGFPFVRSWWVTVEVFEKILELNTAPDSRR